MDTFDSNQLYSSACAPCYSDDSIFFNLILNSNYENTKENCLIFLNNYSKQILLTKRDIFKIFISELTLGEYSSQNICNDESKYLIRQVVKKYSKNNILNALYEFISENDNSSIEQEKNNSFNTNNSSTKKSRKNHSEENEENEKEEKHQKPKRNIKRFNGIRKKPQVKKEKCVTEKKQNENNSSGKKMLNLLTKKRKLSDSPRKEKKDKRPKIDKKEKEKEEKNGKNDKSKKLKKIRKNSDEEDEDKESQKEENENEEKNDEEIKDKNDEEMNEENKEKENQEDNLEEKEEKGSKNKNQNKNKEKKKEKENLYKNKLRHLSSPKNKSVKSFISKSVNKPKTNPKRHTIGDEIIKLDSSEEQNINNSMTLSPLKAKVSTDKKCEHQLDILSYLKLSKSQIINSTTKKYNDNEFRSHLIKDLEKNFVFSFKLKKFQNSKNKIILFDCNNRKCKGRGEYDVNKKIFKETVAHSLSLNSHKLSSFHYNVKETLLNDCDCFGYQLLKDNSFIKDKKVIMIN